MEAVTLERGDQVRYLEVGTGRWRHGRFVRTVTRGARAGAAVVAHGDRLVVVDAAKVSRVLPRPLETATLAGAPLIAGAVTALTAVELVTRLLVG